MRALFAVCCAFLTACATPAPLWSGASTTPAKRNDVALGGAIRVPFGELRDAGNDRSDARDRFARSAQGGGFVPVALYRRGLRRGLDLGLLAAGPSGRLDLRREFATREGSTRPTWMVGGSLLGGALTEDGSGLRIGAEVPLVYGADFGGIYDMWAGVRGGAEYLRGTFDGETRSGVRLHLGAAVGMAVGFRRAHAFVEIAGGYEHTIESGPDRNGFVLVPSFGIRLRL